ncbi:hypothetical protein [Phaeovulum sp. NW3]|uniref:hypothetical protein n=1 Tax=Phaeovulum sp. NW3 TaxID=2934933 RepID=UPI002022162F|nr:hypothetical protein [Phaeovulum sp. NW3]MCL7466257.1 hypothetical protein [Phaeovulum sp. NW3]
MQIGESDTDVAGHQETEDSGSHRIKKEEILSFRCVNRILTEDGLEAEFNLMRSALTRAPTAADFNRVGMGSGSHLLKLTTPRATLDQSVLRFPRAGSNEPAIFAPSVNAPDIPFAKIVYRPLEILGQTPKSLLDHIRAPDDLSASVFGAFASVFGNECLDALRDAVLGDGQKIVRLPDTGEFPTIFLPRPGGGDIQATPVSPVEAFMGFKNMSSAWFLKQEKDAPPVPRGRWTKQSISAKPQNISGAIGGPRQRFLATMPSVMCDYQASIMRYARGGSFPAWRDEDVESAILHYAGRLDMDYTNSDIRAGTDWYADQMILGALDFIEEVRKDARELLEREDKAEKALPLPPQPSALLLRRKWKKDDYQKAMKALTSGHFRDRERAALERLEA